MKSEIKLALKVTSPVLFGYIALGIAFGLMVAEKGYPFWMTPLMSIFMGSAIVKGNIYDNPELLKR